MIGPKFWKLMKRDGFMMTYLRGHKAMRNTHNLGGNLDPVKCRGMDEFGNKYYEDLDNEGFLLLK